MLIEWFDEIEKVFLSESFFALILVEEPFQLDIVGVLNFPVGNHKFGTSYILNV